MENAVLVAKMYMNMVEESHTEQGKQSEKLQLHVVTGGGGNAVNAQWSKWTPSGQLTLNVSNPDAFGKVKPGQYKVYLVPCGADD